MSSKGDGAAILRVVKAGITEKVLFEPRCKEDEVMDDVSTCTKNVVSRGNGLRREHASHVQG